MEEEVKKAGLPTATKVLIGILIGLIVVLGALAAYFGLSAKKNKNESGANVSVTVTSLASKTPSDKIIDDGVTWIKAVKLDDLGLFKKVESQDMMTQVQTISYYKVGTMSDGSEIIDAVISFSPSGFDVYRLLKTGDKYYKVTKNLVKEADNESGIYSEVNLLSNGNAEFKSLESDKEITKGQTKLTFAFNGGIEKAKDYSDGTKVGTTKWGDLYKEAGTEVEGSNGSVEVARYYILLNDSSRAYYEPNPTFLRDDGTLSMSWSDSSKKNLAYQKVATNGCGGGVGTFPEIAKDGVLDGKSQVAPDAKMYFLDNKSNEVDQFVYNLYKSSNGSTNTRSIDEFITNIGLLVWTDDYGSNILFSNKDFAFVGECGKPVVYLYPAKPTQVSVKVGADITKSEPSYGNGWNVLAKPNGELSIAGMMFPYLYWEGQGIGLYPQITSGTIVKTDDAVKTIQEQLHYIGLNQKEISDFVDYWGSKMPQTEYVRLTWLQNQQMDELAPLKISPKPQSVIRVFLDFAGLDSAENIAQQRLEQYTRNGFTAVEWGGLLRK